MTGDFETAGTQPLQELPYLPDETPLAPHDDCQGGIPNSIRKIGRVAEGICSGGCNQPVTWIMGFTDAQKVYHQGYWILQERITGT